MAAVRTVSNDERRARLAIRHRLVATPAEDVVEAADSMTCLHSSDPVTVYLSARARVQGFKQGDLEHALYEEKSLARIHAMRRTLFVVPVEMVSMLHHSSTVALIGPERKRLAGWLESSGIAKDGATWIETVSKKTVAALRRRGEAVADRAQQGRPRAEREDHLLQGRWLGPEHRGDDDPNPLSPRHRREGDPGTTEGDVGQRHVPLGADGRVARGADSRGLETRSAGWSPAEVAGQPSAPGPRST